MPLAANDHRTLEGLKNSGLIRMGDDEALKIVRLSTGIPTLDELLGGGVPLGKCIGSYGPESTGKTLIAQLVTKAVQASQYPKALYMDLEYSYDEPWWQQSGVDTSQLMVSNPTTGEEAIDVMRGVLNSTEDVGIIIVDSLAGMIPQQEMDAAKSSEDNRQPGMQAKLITYMYHQVVPLLKGRTILWSTNQMRADIGGHNEIAALPGGMAQRHYNHIIMRTRRDRWITQGSGDDAKRLGFYMEIINRKNKMARTADGDSIQLPFLFNSQIDWMTSYIEDGVRLSFIKRAGPYYKFNERSLLGLQNLREHFVNNPDEFALLKHNIGILEE